MKALLVADLHYDLRKLDWVLAEAEAVDLLVVAGDLLDIGSRVPLDAQITVSLEYLARGAARATTVVCSGNHDLDGRADSGEKVTRWLAEARSAGVVVDGASTAVGDWLVTACAWWEGPETLARLEADLDEAAAVRTGPWLWAYHGPAEGPLSWTGRRHFGDPITLTVAGVVARRVAVRGAPRRAPTSPTKTPGTVCSSMTAPSSSAVRTPSTSTATVRSVRSSCSKRTSPTARRRPGTPSVRATMSAPMGTSGEY